MHIAMLSASISRNSGGILWVLKSLSMGLIHQGCQITVLGGEDDYTSQDLPTWFPIPTVSFPIVGPNSFGFQFGLIKTLNLLQPDLIHTHGLWMYPSIASQVCASGGKPYIISPHGMLDPWAISNSSLKKKLAGFMYENHHLKRANCIHALNQSEYDSIRRYGLTNPVAVIPNGVDLPNLDTYCPPPEWQERLPTDAKVLFFLSRIHPKKGLVNLLQAWAAAIQKQAVDDQPWHLVIAGWDQGGHQQELEQLADQFGISNTVHFVGPQFDTAKHASFCRADAFILPSFSEGLPMAVLEAWSYQLPVLMTPQCNLPEGFAADAAILIHPNVESISTELVRLFEMPHKDLQRIANNGFLLVQKQFTWEKISKQMFDVYQWLLGKTQKPSCVHYK